MASMAQKSVTLNNARTPVRPAPPPPSSGSRSSGPARPVVLNLDTSATSEGRGKTSFRLPSLNFGASKNVSVKKKAPPPRPPPPKVTSKPLQQSGSFNDLLTAKQQLQNSSAPKLDLLIDWNSPPTSPTPGRSSSDGISLQSFGSDSSSNGTIQQGGLLPRSESGFESESDLWGDNAPTVAPAVQAAVKAFAMPTIIRPNRPKPPANNGSKQPLPIPVTNSSWPDMGKVMSLPPLAVTATPSKDDLFGFVDDDCVAGVDYSPPEPSMPPPPAPPSIMLTTPPQPAPSCDYAVAIYDYQSAHSGDLNFSEGDEIGVIRAVNDEWLYGRCRSSEGMFPAQFVRILSPANETLPASPESPELDAALYQAVALYPFEAETAGDLSLQEGDVLQVTADLANGWLLGRDRSGRKGQFPLAFVQPL